MSAFSEISCAFKGFRLSARDLHNSSWAYFCIPTAAWTGSAHFTCNGVPPMTTPYKLFLVRTSCDLSFTRYKNVVFFNLQKHSNTPSRPKCRLFILVLRCNQCTFLFQRASTLCWMTQMLTYTPRGFLGGYSNKNVYYASTSSLYFKLTFDIIYTTSFYHPRGRRVRMVV